MIMMISPAMVISIILPKPTVLKRLIPVPVQITIIKMMTKWQ